jgi:CcmD family protein
MLHLKRIIFIISLLFCTEGQAQDSGKIKIDQKDYQNSEVEMADQFRADGKIYIVLAVVLIILGGMFGYLFILEKNIRALRKLAEEQE